MTPAADPLAGLQPLREVAGPGWWPLAPGWWLLLLLLVAALAALALWGWRRWQREGYRRQALVELAALERQLQAGDDARTCIAATAILLKRVALAAYPDQPIAALQGDGWAQFLNRTGGPSQAWSSELLAFHYRPHCAPSGAEQLVAASRHWIRHHRRQP